MKNILLAIAFTIFTTTAFSQVQCDSPVVDYAHSNLSTSDIQKVSAATQSLIKVGADPRVIVTNQAIAPEELVNQFHSACPSWKSADGGVKNNLVVYVVNPQYHKSGIFTGAQFNRGALDNATTNNIRTNFMNPAFRDGRIVDGLVAGIVQTSGHINSYNQAASRPNHIFEILILGVILIFVAFFVIQYVRSRKARKLARLAAVNAMHDAMNRINVLHQLLDSKTALGIDTSIYANTVGNFSEQFSQLASNLSTDPSDDSLSTEEYYTIEGQYRNIENNSRSILFILTNLTGQSESPVKSTKSKKGKKKLTPEPSDEQIHPYAPITPVPPPASSTYSSYREIQPNTTTVIHEHYHDNSSGDFLTGMLVGEALERPTRNYDYPTHAVPADSSFGGSSSSYDDSSSSDSWSDSSSSSSDWGSSSSSSDFGSSDSSFGGDSGSW